jgi:hypothetical protein
MSVAAFLDYMRSNTPPELQSVIPALYQDAEEPLSIHYIEGSSSNRAQSALASAIERFRLPSDEVQVMARKVWGRKFETEYVRRCKAAIPPDARPHVASALRATVIRGMYTELHRAFDETG